MAFLSFSTDFTWECLFFRRCLSFLKKKCKQCFLSFFNFPLFQFLSQPIAEIAIFFLLDLNMFCPKTKEGEVFFPFLSFFSPLCFLDVKSVKTLRYTLSSVQAVWISTLPSQHCGSPRLQGECQWTVLQSNEFFPPLSLVKVYLKYIMVYCSDFIMSDLFLCVLTLDPFALLWTNFPSGKTSKKQNYQSVVRVLHT